MFITLEGPEGGGKSTQAARLAEWLRAQGFDVLALREPGGTAIGDRVRAILMDRVNSGMDARAELLLFCASRAQMMSEKVRPHLASGGVVICDRFADSSLAYQGYGRGLEIGILRALLAFATFGVKPDLTLCLDIDAEAGLRRRLANQAEWNRLDAEALEFHRRVRAGYLELAAAEPGRWRVIDADRPADEVEADIRAAVAAALNPRELPGEPDPAGA
jgi:dTMP kinase